MRAEARSAQQPALGGRPVTPHMCEPCVPDALIEALRGLRVAVPDLGLKPLLAKLREQLPELGAATKEVREALATLKGRARLLPRPAPPLVPLPSRAARLRTWR